MLHIDGTGATETQAALLLGVVERAMVAGAPSKWLPREPGSGA